MVALTEVDPLISEKTDEIHFMSPRITTQTKLCLIIGDPVSHSLSPKIHNFAYSKLGVDDQFVYLATRVKSQDLASAVTGIRALGIRGVSCTMPHKSSVIPYLDELDPLAQEIGAINTIVNNDGILWGTNTDIVGIIKPLERAIKISETKFAILGSGGAARAAAIGIKSKGGSVGIFSRNEKTGRDLACKVQGEFFPKESLSELKSFDVLINATPVGMAPLQGAIPFDLDGRNLKGLKLVFDMVYNPENTALLELARAFNILTISGLEMLLEQAIEQIRLFTASIIGREELDLNLLRKFSAHC